MRKTLLSAVAAISLASMTFVLPPSASAETAKPAAAPESNINWTRCGNPFLREIGARCAKISVPLDWNNPSGTKIKIAVSRVKHTVPANKYQGVMLVNPGGPGGSGLTLSVLGNFVPDYRGENVGGAYDWIGFDPRGVGDSEPAVSCDPNYAGAGYNRPNYEPTTSVYNVDDPWPSITNDYTDKCAANNPSGILKFMTTEDVARDMNRIRVLLGESKINYYGFSYGTYLGQVYASLFPTKMRRVVFDGTVDPRGVWYEANLSQDTAFNRNMNIWFGWIAKHDDTYQLGDTRAEVKKLWYDTKDALYATPVDSSGGKLGGAEWNDAFLYAGYYQSTWTDMADVFSAYINNHDVDAFEGAFLDATGYGDDNGYAVYTGVQCTDTAWPKRWSTWYNDNTRINATAPFITWSNAWYNEPCRHWPAKAHHAVEIADRHLRSLLLINETLDAATPYPGSIQVRKIFKRSSLVAVVGGTTHSNSLNGNRCVDVAIAHYLYDGTRPARVGGNQADKTCKALPRPEPSTVTARKAGQSGITRLDLQKIAVRR